jgi:hypothetical protein
MSENGEGERMSSQATIFKRSARLKHDPFCGTIYIFRVPPVLAEFCHGPTRAFNRAESFVQKIRG